MRVQLPLNSRTNPELCDLIYVHSKKTGLTHGEAIVDLLKELLERKANPDYGNLLEDVRYNVQEM